MRRILPLAARISLLFLMVIGFAEAKEVIQAFQPVNPMNKMALAADIFAKNAQVQAVDLDLLKQKLAMVYQRNVQAVDTHGIWIELPLPNGKTNIYQVFPNETMAPALSAKYPEIKSYDGRSLTNERVKFDLTPKGFHAMILRQGKSTVYIDPLSAHDPHHAIVYTMAHVRTKQNMHCGVATPKPKNALVFPLKTAKIAEAYTNCALKKYRLALAATYQYTQFSGGTKSSALASQVTTINRVNGIYETDAGITLQLIGNNDKIICDYPGCPSSPPDAKGVVPYTSGNTSALIKENQVNVGLIIGAGNYDVGHVVDYNGGVNSADGLATLHSVCADEFKARGATSSPQPISDIFAVDFLAHELGHQFGATHTQNNNCNRQPETAVEPGSGNTIMAYAGICKPNVQDNSGPYFHGVSLEQIGEFTRNTATCSVNVPIPSEPRIIRSNGNSIVPIGTPFALTVVASTTAPQAVMTYNWEQVNPAVAVQPPQTVSTHGPNFRSVGPVANPTRYFPSLVNLKESAASGVQSTWEVLSSVPREMDFRITVRNNTPGGSCNAYQDYKVTVVNESFGESFQVLEPSSQGIYWPIGAKENVKWQVANTDRGSIAVGTVDILLSTDGGLTYPHILAQKVPNNGIYTVTVPDVVSAASRIMVVASTGTFFNISEYDFVIALPTLTKAVRDPLKTTSAFIYFTKIPAFWYDARFTLENDPKANVRIDVANQRLVVENLSSPRRMTDAVIKIATHGYFALTNPIAIPGVL